MVVGGLDTTTLPGGKGAFKNAAETSSDATACSEEDAPQDRGYLIMAVSRSVVDTLP